MHRWYADKLGGALLGVGVTGLGVGIAYYISSSSAESSATSAPTYSRYVALSNRAEDRRVLAWVGIGAGTALVSGAALRYWMAGRRSGRDERPSLAVAPSANGAQLVLSGSF